MLGSFRLGRSSRSCVRATRIFQLCVCFEFETATRRTERKVLVLIPGFRRQMIRGIHVAPFDEVFPVFAIHGRVGGRPGSQAIDVAVVHAEGRSDQDGVVNFFLGCAILPCAGDIILGNLLATFLHLAGDWTTSEAPTTRQKNANPCGQDMLWVAEYAFFTRSILFFRLGGRPNATRREPRPKSFVGARPSDT
jgi:hypothetical protein